MFPRPNAKAAPIMRDESGAGKVWLSRRRAVMPR